jgi:hypothetical protein
MFLHLAGKILLGIGWNVVAAIERNKGWILNRRQKDDVVYICWSWNDQTCCPRKEESPRKPKYVTVRRRELPSAGSNSPYSMLSSPGGIRVVEGCPSGDTATDSQKGQSCMPSAPARKRRIWQSSINCSLREVKRWSARYVYTFLYITRHSIRAKERTWTNTTEVQLDLQILYTSSKIIGKDKTKRQREIKCRSIEKKMIGDCEQKHNLRHTNMRVDCK